LETTVRTVMVAAVVTDAAGVMVAVVVSAAAAERGPMRWKRGERLRWCSGSVAASAWLTVFECLLLQTPCTFSGCFSTLQLKQSMRATLVR